VPLAWDAVAGDAPVVAGVAAQAGREAVSPPAREVLTPPVLCAVDPAVREPAAAPVLGAVDPAVWELVAPRVRGVVNQAGRPVVRGGSAQDGRVTWTLPLVIVTV
jgi:hypothetical protein